MCKYRKDIIHREMWSQSTTASQRSVHPECYQCSAKLITVFRGCFCFTDEVLFHFSFHMHPVQRFDCLTPAVMEAAVGKPPQPRGWHICVKWKFILSCTDGPTGCYHMVAGYINWMEYFSFLQLIVVVFWTQMLLFHSPLSSLLFPDRKQIKLVTPWSI